MMLKQNADVFRDNEQIFLRSEIEKVVAKFSTSKNIRELFENLKDQRLSSMNKNWKSWNPLKKTTLFGGRDNRRKRVFSQDGQPIPEAKT